MKTNREFLSALDRSRTAVWVAAQWLLRQGYDAQIRPALERPTFEDRNEFADNGDIEIKQRVEVKHRFLSFTNEDSYPYDTVIVDEKYKIDRINSAELYQYIILNEEMTHCCVVYGITRSQWVERKKYDKKDRQTRTFYECPVSLCSFYSLE